MSVVETVLVYVLIPAGVLAVLALLTVAPHRSRRPRYRSGQPWEYAPVWWSANPDGLVSRRHTGRAEPVGARELTAGGVEATTAVGGGARGTW